MFKKLAFILIIYSFWSCVEFSADPLKNEKKVDLSLPEVEISNFSTKAYKLGNQLWILNADNARLFESDKKVMLDNLRVFFYDSKQKPTSKVIADYGIYYKDVQNFDLSNNVTMASSNNKVLVGEFFHWDNKKERLTTHLEATVSNLETGEWHRGTGMVADKNLETVDFLSNNVGGFIDTRTN